ncbi:hypothetical protein ACFLXE_08005 [Chloroflexota bacterium]
MVAETNAVEGAEHFNGQAFYDTAVNYTRDRSGATRGIAPTKRNVTNKRLMLQWDVANNVVA